MRIDKYIYEYEESIYVRIRFASRRLQRSFSISKYGGKEKTLRIAVRYRNKLLRQHDQLFRLDYKKNPDLYRNAKNPIIGVYFTYHKQTSGNISSFWTARVSIKDKEVKRHFSIIKYGYNEAFLKACEIRYKYANTLRIINKKALPCKPTVPHIFL